MAEAVAQTAVASSRTQLTLFCPFHRLEHHSGHIRKGRTTVRSDRHSATGCLKSTVILRHQGILGTELIHELYGHNVGFNLADCAMGLGERDLDAGQAWDLQQRVADEHGVRSEGYRGRRHATE